MSWSDRLSNAMQGNENDDETDQNQWLVELTFLAMQVAAFCTSRETPSKPQNLQNVLNIDENFDEHSEESLVKILDDNFDDFFATILMFTVTHIKAQNL